MTDATPPADPATGTATPAPAGSATPPPPADFSTLSVDAQISNLNTRLSEIESGGVDLSEVKVGLARLTHHIFGE